MSTFLSNALAGGAAILSLLTALYAPMSLAGEGHSEHEQHAAQVSAAVASPERNATQAEQKANGQQPDHAAMNHAGMGHESMKDKHGGAEAEAGLNHDH